MAAPQRPSGSRTRRCRPREVRAKALAAAQDAGEASRSGALQATKKLMRDAQAIAARDGARRRDFRRATQDRRSGRGVSSVRRTACAGLHASCREADGNFPMSYRLRHADQDDGETLSARAVAAPDAGDAAIRQSHVDSRRCDRAQARLQGRHDRRSDAFQPVRAAVRGRVGTAVAGAGLPFRALPQRVLRRREGAGLSDEAAPQARSRTHDLDAARRRHRDPARHRIMGTDVSTVCARTAPRRTLAARQGS